MDIAIDTGDTAWVLAATALVLFMTPGLALFYGGMVRAKNVLAMLMQNFFTMGLVAVLWAVVCYSLAFGNLGDDGWLGDFDNAFMRNFNGEVFGTGSPKYHSRNSVIVTAPWATAPPPSNACDPMRRRSR